MTLNLDEIVASFPECTTQKVAEMVVCARYFRFEQPIIVACMQELANRRSQGDTFPFESFIDEEFNKLPKLMLEMPDLRSMLMQFSRKGQS